MSKTRPNIDVHPKTYLPSTLESRTFDVVIIGGGPTAQTAAVRLVSASLSVLLIEEELVGGECQNWACIPSKALLRPLEIADDALRVGGTREKISTLGKPSVDVPGLWSYRDRTTSSWDDKSMVESLEGMKMKIVHGRGTIEGAGKVKVTDWHSKDEVEVSAKYVMVATGSEPIVPESCSGLVEAGYWIPRDAVSAKEVPEHLIVLGAGPVGTEFATIYARLGSNVTLITTRDRIMPSVNAEAVSRVRKGVEAMGVRIMTNTRTLSAKREGKEVTVTFEDGSQLVGSEILVAAGRKTRTTGMGLAALGIKEALPVSVNDHMQANGVDWLYAVGDTNGIGNTTHMGMYEATIAAQHIIRRSGKNIVAGTDTVLPHLRQTVPQTCYTEPQVSWVGLSHEQAHARGWNAKEVSVETGGPGTHSYLYAEGYDGWAQWVIECGTGRILGATFVGNGVPNLLHASTVAVVNGLTWMQMLHAVPSFPTLGEVYHLLVQACLASKL